MLIGGARRLARPDFVVGIAMATNPRRPRTATPESSFETPPAAPGTGPAPGTLDNEQFEPPPGQSEGGAEEHAFAVASAADPELHEMKQQLEQIIFARSESTGGARSFAAGEQVDPMDAITG